MSGLDRSRKEKKARSQRLALGGLSSLGIVAAAVITVCTNIMVARFYTRWDVTRGRLYSLSTPSLDTVRGLSEPATVLVFLAKSDPQRGAVERLLAQYRAESRLLDVRYIDPDRNPAEFVALSNRYRLMEGRAQDGRLVSDAAMVVVLGDARWVISADDLVAYDDERGTLEPRLEQAITEGLRQVLSPKAVRVCFSQGHGEPSLDDGGPTGLGALRHTLETNNYETREVNLGDVGQELALTSCDLVIVAAPEQRFEATAAARLVALARRGTSILASVGPVLDEDNRAAASGLEPLFELFGLTPQKQLIFERDPDAIVPLGVGGEVFLATPKPHPITAGLLDNRQTPYRVLLQLGQAFAGQGEAQPLLATSDRAFSVDEASFLAVPGTSIDRVAHDAEGPFVVAMASALGAVEQGVGAAAQAAVAPRPGGERRARLVALGSSSPLLGHTWQDPTLAGTRRFVEGSVAWLSSRPSLVSLAAKPERRVTLQFTESAMSEVARYVLLYMPMTALALGVLILYRRRWKPASAATTRAEGETS